MIKTKLAEELGALSQQGREILLSEVARYAPDRFPPDECKEEFTLSLKSDYQGWYTVAFRVIKVLAPERLDDFVTCYEPDPKRKFASGQQYKIRDFVLGYAAANRNTAESAKIAISHFKHQLQIVEGLSSSMNSTLFDIKQEVIFEVIDAEIQSAEALHKIGQIRAAGALVGVVIEAHLASVFDQRGLKITKKNPAIADYNDRLKSEGIISVNVWRLIQRLGDIRNSCVHKRQADPTSDEVADLISGAKKITAEVM